MAGLKKNISDAQIVEICMKYFGAGGSEPLGATEISAWLKKEGYECSRERVHRLIGIAIKRKFVMLHPPRDEMLAQRMADKFNLDVSKIRVVKTVRGADAEQLAPHAAELLLDLIKKIAEEEGRVHVGFGAGRTVQRVVRALSILLRAEENIPPLTVHAMSVGFSVFTPTYAPVVFLSYFTEISPRIEFVGLFAPAVVQCKEYEHIKKLPGIRETFELRNQIHVVVTSMARRADRHGLLNKFMDLASPPGRKALEGAGWTGDVAFRPFSDSGPIRVDSDIRCVTTMEIDEMVRRLTGPRNHHALLVVSRCNECWSSRASALYPLLTQPSLRLFDHLVLDDKTADEVLDPSRLREVDSANPSRP